MSSMPLSGQDVLFMVLERDRAMLGVLVLLL